MALVFPLTLNDFFGNLPITSAVPDLGENFQMSETGSGEILTAAVGQRLWKIDVTLALGYYGAMEAIKAKADVLRYPGRSLFVHAFPVAGPQYDPTGAILGASAVKLNLVETNNRELKLSGLPNGYIISPGDSLSFSYGANPTRYAMHRVVTGSTANIAGITGDIEVTPFVQPGFVLDAPVTLIKPFFKAIMVPGSFNPGKSGQQITDGVAMSFLQTFR